MARKKVRKPLTKNQQAFLKEQKRIERYLKAKAKQNLTIPNFKIPEMPSRVTAKKLREIKELTGRKLSLRLRLPSGEKPEKKPRKKKASETTPPIKEEPAYTPPAYTENEPSIANEIEYSNEPMTSYDSDWAVIQGFFSHCEDSLPPLVVAKLVQIINQYIGYFGVEETAQALNDMPTDVREFMWRYGSDFDYTGFTTEFLDYIPGGVTKNDRQRIEDILEEQNLGFAIAT